MRMKKGQSWSIDVIIGVIVFMMIIAVFYAFIANAQEPTLQNLQGEARSSSVRLLSESTQTSIVSEGIIQVESFDQLCEMEYEQVKALLGVENDVCIFFEDENGNIIPCGTPDLSAPFEKKKLGIGTGQDILITQGHYCGEVLS